MIDILHDLIPPSQSRITNIGTITADNVLASLDEQGVKYEFTRLSAGDWEIEASELTDNQILELLHIQGAGHAGTLMICTEACSRYDYEPFSCDSERLEQFINGYDFEMFFDGDVIMASKQSRTLTVYHHAGGVAHVKL